MPFKYSLRVLNLIFAVILLLLSSFFIIKLNDSIKRIEVFAFLEDDLDAEKIEELKEQLLALKVVGSMYFSSPEETVKTWAKTLGRQRLLELIGKNPFPPLFQIKLRRVGSTRSLHRVVEALQKIPGIKTVEYGGETTEEGIRRTQRYLFISVFLFFVALVNILDHIFIVKR